MSRRTTAALCACALMLAGCAGSLTGDTYDRDEARKIQNVRYATVVATRPVVIEGTKTGLGALAGAAVGGIAGSAVGEGKGSDVAAVVGGVVGAVAGGKIEEAGTRAQGIEIILKPDGGEEIAVVQAASPADNFRPGDRVRILTSGGTTRVTP